MPQSQDLQNSKTDLLSTRSLNFNGRQIKNAGDAIDSQDYVTLAQVNSLISAAIPSTTENRTSITISGIVKNGKPGAVLFIGTHGTLDQDSLNFSYSAGVLSLTTGIKLSSLTASQPVKSDASKNLISGLIVLTTDVSGILPVPNGGSGAGSFTANAVLVGNGSGTFGTRVGVTGTLSLSLSPATAVISVGSATVTLQYKDWTGTNQSQVVVTGVSSSFGIFETGPTLTTNAFTNGVRTT